MSEDARYILAKKIARGGMAEILSRQTGRRRRLPASVRHKAHFPHYSGDNEFIQMFRDEAHICKRLQHANIVRVEGFEEVEGSYAIIMEFVDGADLRTLLHAVEQAKKKMPYRWPATSSPRRRAACTTPIRRSMRSPSSRSASSTATSRRKTSW